MYIYGRAILTANGLMLDEVRSLLQKALRRKDVSLVLQSTKELLASGDQLPWRCLVTYLFEDHCLSDETILAKMYELFSKDDKYGFIELLLKCYTDRIAACLPVIALMPKYEPHGWNVDIHVEAALQDLVEQQADAINLELLLAHIQRAWTEANHHELLTYCKLASIVHDNLRPSTVTPKGYQYLIDPGKLGRRKPNFVHIVLSLMYKSTSDKTMKKYVMCCYNMATIPGANRSGMAGNRGANMRLILFSVLSQLMFRQQVKMVTDLSVGKISWKTVPKLETMPHWAVDKHTFRGRNGTSSRRAVEKPADMTEDLYEEFHGRRPQQGIECFFEVGCLCKNPTIDNPFWEETKKIYFSRPQNLQKTIKMTAAHYEHLKVRCPTVVYGRSCSLVPSYRFNGGQASRMGKIAPYKPTVQGSTEEVLNFDSAEINGPLLQVPTGGAKVHTCYMQGNVFKGPYRNLAKLNQTMFFHAAMRVLGDPHTLSLQRHGQYLVFPVVKAQDASLEIVKKDYYDAITKKQVIARDFVSRESMGLIQLHKLEICKLRQIPITMWAHFIFRYCLNVGDSGLYNAITDSQTTFVYGIDMEETRKQVVQDDLINFMFSKLPSKQRIAAVQGILTANKAELLAILLRPIKHPTIDRLAAMYPGAKYNRLVFLTRMLAARKMVSQL